METFLTKTMTIVALICFLVVGAAVTAILGRDSVPAASPQLAAASAAVVQAPVSNKESKKDRLAVVSYALAAYEPPQTTAALSEPLRQGYALYCSCRYRVAEGSCEPDPQHPPVALPKPKAVAKPNRRITRS